MSNIIQLSRRRFMRGQIKKESLPRLPWAVEEKTFLHGCTQCNKCISSCEQDIIKRDKLGFPFVDFDQDECSFCNKCIDICDEPIFNEPKLGPAFPGDFNINNKCLAKNNIYCQSCRDVCDSKAISFTYLESAIPEPELNLSDCNQCGACVSICPQDAITFQLETIKNERI